MPEELLNEVIMTDYGQFDLVWSGGEGFQGEWDEIFDGQVNGLVGAAKTDGIYINLARRAGGSPVRIVLHDEAPQPPDDEWEDVVEVSTTIPPGEEVRYQSWANESSGVVRGIVDGSYRVRVSARGRDAARGNQFADGPVDVYLVELWPAPITDDAVVRVTSEDARYWHREVGSRR